MDQSDYLLTLAEIAIALAGFGGIIVAISSRRERTPGEINLDLELLKNVLRASFMTTGFALLPATLMQMGEEPAAAIEVSCGVYALSVSAYCVFQYRRARAVYTEASRTMPIGYSVNSSLAIAFSIANGLAALGAIPREIYYPSVVFMLYGSASSFVRVFVSVARAF